MMAKKKRYCFVLFMIMILSIMVCTPSYALTKRVRTMRKTTGVPNPNNYNERKSIKYTDSVNWGRYDVEAYHKLVIPQNGRIWIAAGDGSRGFYACLCDSKYRTVQLNSTGTYVSPSYASILAVKKGTYYIRVRGYSKYSLDATFTPLSDVGSSKSSAKYVSKTGKNTVAIMPVGEPSNRCDWYKFYVPYRQRVNLSYLATGHGRLSFYLLDSSNHVLYKRQIGLTSSRSMVRRNNSIVSVKGDGLDVSGVLNRGTYYVKVMRTAENRYKRTSANSWFHWTN